MEVFLSVLESQTVLILYFLLGIFLKRRKVLTDSGVDDLARLVVNVLLPISIFDSFQIDLTPQEGQMALVLLMVSGGVCLLSYGLGLALFRGYPADKQSVMRYSALISNCTFVGVPLLSSIYGAKGVLYASVFVIPNRFFMWSLGVAMFEGKKTCVSLPKLLLNPCMLSCLTGVAAALLPWPLPRIVTRMTGALGACNGPLSMLTIGAILAQVEMRRSFNRDTLYISLVRLLLIPWMVQGILTVAGVDSAAIAVSVLLTGMPLANTVILLAKQYDCQVELAAQATLASVALSLFTVPILTLFL